MCFPTLKQTCCCCSLKTGMIFICCIGIVWNLMSCLNASKTDPPDFLKFLDTQYSLSYGHHFVDHSQLYYAIQIFALIFAFFGAALDSLCCLIPLVVSETLILLMYFLEILTYLLKSLNNVESKGDPLIALFILFVYHYYACAIIFSFYSQVSKGEDGREHGISGVIITTSTQTASSPSASAPCPNDQNLQSVSYVNSPYATQPPYAPVVTHGEPCLMYPPNEYAQTAMPSAPYYMPQSVGMNEKPPPYAP
ncbi:uncharacterized protein LOC135834515 [Planococcus citri]|uniref:uncharacterized protein LOC135834515 n=1 Tax=Planococcus citri TaxID=170843 RepID=UPI0031F985F6